MNGIEWSCSAPVWNSEAHANITPNTVGRVMQQAEINLRSVVTAPLQGTDDVWQMILRVNAAVQAKAVQVLRDAGFKVISEYVEDLTAFLPVSRHSRKAGLPGGTGLAAHTPGYIAPTDTKHSTVNRGGIGSTFITMAEIINIAARQRHLKNLITAAPLEFRRGDWQGGFAMLCGREQSRRYEEHRREALRHPTHHHIGQLPEHVSLTDGYHYTALGLFPTP